MLSGFFSRLAKMAWFLPGFILWAAFPPMAEKADCLFALVPLMWLSRNAGAAESAKRWFQSGIFFWTATLSWMPAIVKNGGPLPLVIIGWSVLALYSTLYFAAYGYLSAGYWSWARGKKGPWAGLVGALVVEPVLWSGLELLRSRLFGGFAWNLLGVVGANSPFGAPAQLGGVYLLSALVIMVNGAFAGMVERIVQILRRRKVNRWRSLETVAAVLAVWAIYAVCPALSPQQPQDGRFVKVAMIQRNFPCCFKGPEENPMSVYEDLYSKVSPLGADLVVLPESAMCEFGPVDGAGAKAFARFSFDAGAGSRLLAGGSRRSGGLEFNSAALYSMSEGGVELSGVYDKVHLVPFGEYIPGDKTFTFLQRFAPVGSCTPGTPKLLSLDDGNGLFGVGICFEDTDSALMRRYAAMGAKFLVFITNDSWFSHSNEAVQHSWHAVVRAIETNLPVVRVGNSGVTGTIAPDGRYSWITDADGDPVVDRRCTMFDRIRIAPDGTTPQPTWYVRLGDAPLAVVFGLLILCMILVKYKNRYEKRRYLSM